MKVYICFPYTDGPYGGGNQFLKALRTIFIEKNIYTSNVEEADIILFNSMNGLFDAYKCKRKNKKAVFVHRVDGPCKLYNNESDYRDDQVYRINARIADATVFQSEFSKNASIKMGCPHKKYEVVIHNACDQSVFYPTNISFAEDKALFHKVRLIATSYSDNWNKGFKDYQWLDKNLDFSRYEMKFVGRTPCEFDNIEHISPVGSEDLAEYLRGADIYIIASRKEPCSNALIEAISSGLPVIAYNDGSHPEVIGRNGEIYSAIEEVPRILDSVLQNYSQYAEGIERFDIHKVANEYEAFFDELLELKRKGIIVVQRCNPFHYWMARAERIISKILYQ